MDTSKLSVEVRHKIKSAKVPVIYEEAVRAIATCRTIDEGQYWSEKADALAAWAKIYRSKDAEVEARRLKLHAYRRMGELAEELRPNNTYIPGVRGQKPGSASLLIESGLSKSQANLIKNVARVPKSKFDSLIESKKPPTPNQIKVFGLGLAGKVGPISSDSYRIFTNNQSAVGFRSTCRKYPAAELARGIDPGEVAKCKNLIAELQEWLDEFEQNLPKEKRK